MRMYSVRMVLPDSKFHRLLKTENLRKAGVKSISVIANDEHATKLIDKHRRLVLGKDIWCAGRRVGKWL